MPRRVRSESGFTLVELMMTVALIGVMSAIAIPNFISFQARSRRAEATTNLTGLSRSYKSFYAEEDRFPDIVDESPNGDFFFPAGTASTTKRDWPPDAYTFFGITGFQPEGPIYYSYGVVSQTGCVCSNCFTAYAYGDVDADSTIGGVIYVHPDSNGLTCAEPILGWNEPPGQTDMAAFVTPGANADDF